MPTLRFFWKVAIVLDRSGLSIDTLGDRNGGGIVDLIAVDIPNDFTDPRVESQDWQRWKQPVDLIESLTDLNFLSNLSDEVENRIEMNRDFQVYVPHSSLLGDQTGELLFSQDSEFFFNTSVRHNSLIENNFMDTLHEVKRSSILEISPSEISKDSTSLEQFRSTQVSSSEVRLDQAGTTQINTFQHSSLQGGTLKIRFTQVGSIQLSISESGSDQIGTTQIGSDQIGTTQIGSDQIGTTQIGSDQIGTTQIGSDQISLAQIDSRKLNSIQLNLSQINPTEISLPSSITLQQLLSSHNPNLQNTTVPTWTEFIQSPTPFNLKIEVTDLPTGQLASATITGYDTNGRPNSGTLTLDTDGNSLGWFIDTTPDDNSEFTTQLADTAYKATADSAAYGKYDILTTILHELGHLKGIIRGNSAFDTHVQNINGIPTFINGGLTATLTLDGSHLDTTFHPYDLMNTSLKPGVRKLPSALNLAMIDAINAGIGNRELGVAGTISAPLTAGALIGITNGDFTTPTT